MNLNFATGAAAVAALCLPVLLIFFGRLYKNGSLFTLFFYYLLNAVYNTMSLNIIVVPELFKSKAAAFFNYLDTPMMLLVLLFFCNEKWKRQMIIALLAIFLVFEMVIAVFFGLDRASSIYLLGPGTLLLLGLSIYFFAHYGKVSIVQGKGTGKTLMLVSIIFSYGCFLILYYLHYLQRTTEVADVYLIYYIVTFISAVLMSLGLIWIIKRSRQINELLTTRKELALFFDK
ncbi:MAG TPA: hypothetical protein VM010_01245 [Chitinophagaceae bacterium]|nr:hypothetical protein [Chitinophagaceae bacterium]